MPGKDVIPTIPYRLSRSRYRHSRVSGNPAAAGLDIAIPHRHSRLATVIPA